MNAIGSRSLHIPTLIVRYTVWLCARINLLQT
jgi:hypothetical protein